MPYMSNTTFKKSYVSLLCSSVAFIAASPVYAQDAEPSANIALDEIIVTARRKSENLQSTPVTVSAFNANSLENLGVNNNIDLARFTPSVVFDNTSTFAGIDSFQATIRGVGQTDFALNTDPGVGLYIDGVYIARAPGAVTELLDIERIEVLKGPQGTLFGRNAIGGAVSIVTKKPSDEFYARGEVKYGTFNNVEVSGVINTPLTDNINASVAFSADTIDGFQDRIPFPSDFAALGPVQGAASTSTPLDQILVTNNSSGRDPGAKAGGTIRAKVAWDITDDVDFIFSADTTIRRDAANPTTLLEVDPNALGGASLAGLFNGCNSLGAAPIIVDGNVVAPPRSALPCLSNFLPTTTDADGNVVGINFDGSRPDQLFTPQFITDDIDQTFATGANFANSNSQGLSGEVNWRINDNVAFKSITAYRELESEFGLDIDSSPLAFDQTSFILDTEQFSQEIQFEVNYGDRFDATIGGYFFNEDGAQLDNVPIAGGLIQVAGGFEQETTAWAGFGEANYEIVDGIKILFGARFTSEEKTLQLDQQNLNTTFSTLGLNIADLPRPDAPQFLAQEDPLSETFNNFSIRAGANWQVNDDLFTFFNFSQGFKSGGFTTRLTTFFSEGVIAAADAAFVAGGGEGLDPNILRDITFDEETSNNYEAGFKAKFLDSRVRLNASAFWNSYDDIQLVVQRGVSPANENAARARIRGIELDAEALITEDLRLNATFGYLDAEFREIDPAAAPLLVNRFGQNLDLDTPLANTPEVTASAALNYNVTDNLSVNGNVSYISEVTNDAFAVENLVQDGFALFGASVAYDTGESWNLKLGVDNIGDERFIVSGFEGGALPFTIGSFNRGREFYAKFGYNF